MDAALGVFHQHTNDVVQALLARYRMSYGATSTREAAALREAQAKKTKAGHESPLGLMLHTINEEGEADELTRKLEAMCFPNRYDRSRPYEAHLSGGR